MEVRSRTLQWGAAAAVGGLADAWVEGRATAAATGVGAGARARPAAEVVLHRRPARVVVVVEEEESAAIDRWDLGGSTRFGGDERRSGDGRGRKVFRAEQHKAAGCVNGRTGGT